MAALLDWCADAYKISNSPRTFKPTGALRSTICVCYRGTSTKPPSRSGQYLREALHSVRVR